MSPFCWQDTFKKGCIRYQPACHSLLLMPKSVCQIIAPIVCNYSNLEEGARLTMFMAFHVFLIVASRRLMCRPFITLCPHFPSLWLPESGCCSEGICPSIESQGRYGRLCRNASFMLHGWPSILQHLCDGRQSGRLSKVMRRV